MNKSNVIKTNDGIAIRVSNETIDNLMIIALEKGILHWCNQYKIQGEYLGNYANEQIARGGELLLYKQNTRTKPDKLTKDIFLLGVKIVFEEYKMPEANWFKRIDAGAYEVNPQNYDSELADLIIQCGLFGEPMYHKRKEIGQWRLF